MFEWIIDNFDNIVIVVLAINTIAGVITAATPTPTDDNVLRFIRKWLNMAALNVGHARNAESVGADPNAPDKPVS